MSTITTQADLTTRVRANFSLLALTTPEEQRALHALAQVATELKRTIYVWSITRGVQRFTAGELSAVPGGGEQNPALFSRALAGALPGNDEPISKAIVVALDFAPYLRDPVVVRAVRDALADAQANSNTGVFLGAQLELPPELRRECADVELTLPEAEELRRLVTVTHGANAAKKPELVLPAGDSLVALVDGMRGLTLNEAENALALALVRAGQFDHGIVSDEKARAVKTSGALEIIKPKGGLESVGGLEGVKAWIRTRGKAFGADAREYGLPNPKGALLVGVQGCGKSLTAKAAAATLGLPLVRLNVGALFGGIVGASEANVRQALRTLDAIAPCVCLVDELEKAFAGGKGSNDGGVSARLLGEFLTWTQEHESPVFLMATANDVTQLPPELLRRGRWDTMLFVDLPNPEERAEILRIQLARVKVNSEVAADDLAELARRAEGFSGAELEQVITDSMFEAFADGVRPIQPADVREAIEATVPLSKTMAEPINSLREWAKTRCTPANGRTVQAKAKASRGGRAVH